MVWDHRVLKLLSISCKYKNRFLSSKSAVKVTATSKLIEADIHALGCTYANVLSAAFSRFLNAQVHIKLVGIFECFFTSIRLLFRFEVADIS